MKKHKLRKTILFGLLSIGVYSIFFLNSLELAKLFAKGQWYAIYPIATVFLFSFIHGTFASNVWSCLGIEPKTLRKSKSKRVVRPRPRPRLGL